MPIPQTIKKNNSEMAQLLKQEPEIFSIPKIGDLTEARLIAKALRAAYFDLGSYGNGIVYGAEYINAKNVIKELEIGETTPAKIIDLENDEGYIELSIAEASQQKKWREVKELFEKDEPLKVKIIGANAGGVTAEISSIKAFMPVSQLANEHYPRVGEGNRTKIAEELKKFIGQEFTVKIIDVNTRANKLIISERAATEQNVKELLLKYSVGQVIDGIISGVADFGAFVRFADNPLIEGLIHISEIDHKLIDNPKDVVKVGDLIKAQIIEIKDDRVSLSLKALKPDPWEKVEKKYKTGETVQGSVAKFNPFGAFINLDEEIQGIIHVSEFGGIEEMKKELELGKSYHFLIDSVKPQEKRILLKLKK
ncbi:MAG: RNA binding S1 domain protein [Parcubacteria group bacterium GW2011_GWB1_45_9]|nr:MAG: RNA binding S1 domain protein [Parcubacteria group bacterium GW2011_GWB1_45_9]